MKKLVVIALFVCFSFISCQSSKNEDKNDDENIENTQNKQEDKNNNNLINDPRSPNPSSELAVLMRDMWEYGDTLKMAISNQNTASLPDYRSGLKEIHNAIATDQNTKSAAFDAMATIMLQRLETVYQNSSQNKEQSVQVEGFNLLIKSCLQCHEQQCPGPIPKISKLMIVANK